MDEETGTFSAFGLDHVRIGGGLHYLRRAQTMFSYLGQIDGMVLDVACGDARHCAELIARGAEQYIGADMDGAVLRSAKANMASQNANLVRCDVRQLRFPSESFDLVLCTETLEHVKEEETPVEEIARVLKTGGVALLSVPSTDLRKYLSLLRKSLSKSIPDKPYQDPSHWREYGRWQFDNKIARLGRLTGLLGGSGLSVLSQRAAWVLGPLPPGKYWGDLLSHPEKHTSMVRLLSCLDGLLGKFLKNFGLYTVLACRKG